MPRIAAALSALLLLLAGLTGCSDGPSADGDRIEAAALTGLSVGDQVDVEEFVDIVLAGIDRSTTARMRMETSFGAEFAMTAEGVVDYTGSQPAAEMTLEMPGGLMAGELSVITVDGVLYLSMGEFTDGGYWEVDPSDPSGPLAGMGLDRLLEQSEPRSSMETLAPAIEEVTFVGTEDVDGRELDRYALTVDPQEAVAALGADLGGGVEASVPDSISYDLWLDEEHRFARMLAEYPVLGETATADIEAYDWGADVTVEAPPAADLVEAPPM